MSRPYRVGDPRDANNCLVIVVMLVIIGAALAALLTGAPSLE